MEPNWPHFNTHEMVAGTSSIRNSNGAESSVPLKRWPIPMHPVEPYAFFLILSDYRFRNMHELSAKTTLVHLKPIRVCWIISSSLQAIGLECPVWVYPTLEKGDPRAKLSKARNKKLWSSCVCCRHCPWGILLTKFIMNKVSFLLIKKSIEVSQIYRILASTIWPTSKSLQFG